MLRRICLLVPTVALVALLALPEVRSQTMPTGCIDDGGIYECDYVALNNDGDVPITTASFNPIPQRLRLVNLPASLTSSIFDSDFTSMSASDYDTNCPATLELKCTNSNRTMTFASPFFSNMGHIQDFRIINCALGNLASGAFAELGTLDRFSIENGSITSLDSGMLNGVTIRKDFSASPTYPVHKGEFALKHTKLSGSLPTDFLSGQTEVHTIILDGLGISTISQMQFSGNSKMRFLSIGWNDLAEIPSGLFDGLDSLAEIRLYDTAVTCSCDNLWFITHAKENFISLHGDFICNDGTHKDKHAMKYYNEVCAVEVPIECSGLELAGSCIGMVNFAMLIITFLSFIMGFALLAIVINLRKELNPNQSAKVKSKRPTPGPRSNSLGPANVKKGWH